MSDGTHRRELVPDWDPALALANVARAAGPPLLFGLRLWASVCLALYVAFWLELDNAYWAGTSAAIVCQPHLGASLRKGWFRMIGTLVGAFFVLVLTGLFPQSRFGFLVGLALWGGACAVVATLLRNFAAYAAALAGFTAAIIASDQLGATGGPNGQAFMLAVYRVSEIWIGIVSAGIVLAGTDFGGAPRRLAAQFAALLAEIANGFSSSLASVRIDSSDTLQPVRRELIRRVIALDPVIDESIGESSRLRYHSPVLQNAFDALFIALAGWRGVMVRLRGLGKEAAAQEISAVLRNIPQEIRSAAQRAEPTAWMNNASGLHAACEAGVRRLTIMSTGTPSLRLLADHIATVLSAFAAVLDGLALLIGNPILSRSQPPHPKFYVADWLPALVSGGRAFVTIGAMELFWIASAWPSGALAITFTAIGVILLAPRAEQAYSSAVNLMAGVAVAAVCAAIILFAVLPKMESFPGFGLALALYLVPAGALMAQSSQAMFVFFVAMTGNFIPLLAPANQMNYDQVQFYNSALAIVVGSAVAAMSFRLLPPLSPAFRIRRLMALTLRDLRRLASHDAQPLPEEWERRIYVRLAAVPDVATPLQRAQLITALSVGNEVIHLRRTVAELGLEAELDSALEPMAQGDSAAAVARLEHLDQHLGSIAESDGQALGMMRERSRILLICDALVQHRAYFDAEESE
jgi:uncharacterized membrane protein YccC